MDLVLSDLQDGIGTIILNNPSRRNCLTRTMLDGIVKILEDFEGKKTRAVILRAPLGSKVWSAGLDITELPRPGRDPLSYGDPLERALRAVQRFPAPVIAMIEGGVWGGACDLVFVCDILVGASSATFAITPARVGIPYNCSGILHFVNAVGTQVAKEMFFTAKPLTAKRAQEHGVLNYLVASEELEGFTLDLARSITENSPLAISVIKEQLRILGNSHPINPETFERIQGLRRIVYDSRDYLEGIQAFMEKRKPRFTGE